MMWYPVALCWCGQALGSVFENLQLRINCIWVDCEYFHLLS